MSQVTITYKDISGLSSKELKNDMTGIFGESCNVVVTPDTNSPDNYIKFALQELITQEQAECYFDTSPREYIVHMQDIKHKTLKNIAELLDQVVATNESKWE